MDHILSDLSTMTRPSWVAPRAWLIFIELDKAVVRKGGGEEIPLFQGKEQRLRFAGSSHEEIPHIQGKRNPSKTKGKRASEGRHTETIITEGRHTETIITEN